MTAEKATTQLTTVDFQRSQANLPGFGTGGGTRTHKPGEGRRILSPVCIPFHHTSKSPCRISPAGFCFSNKDFKRPAAYLRNSIIAIQYIHRQNVTQSQAVNHWKAGHEHKRLASTISAGAAPKLHGCHLAALVPQCPPTAYPPPAAPPGYSQSASGAAPPIPKLAVIQ